MSILKELVKVTGVTAKAKEGRQAYLVRLVAAVSDLSEDDWGTLTDESQDFINEAITAIKAEEPVVDPEVEAEPEPVKAKAKTARPKRVAEEQADAEEEEEEADEEEEEESEPEPVKAKRGRKPKKAEPEEEEEEEADEEEEEEEEAEPEPVKAKRGRPAKAKKAEPEEEEEEDDEDEAKPARKIKPGGYGTDSDKFRVAYAKAFIEGKDVDPIALRDKLKLGIVDTRARCLSWDMRKAIGALRTAKLIVEKE